MFSRAAGGACAGRTAPFHRCVYGGHAGHSPRERATLQFALESTLAQDPAKSVGSGWYGTLESTARSRACAIGPQRLPVERGRRRWRQPIHPRACAQGGGRVRWMRGERVQVFDTPKWQGPPGHVRVASGLLLCSELQNSEFLLPVILQRSELNSLRISSSSFSRGA